MSAPSENESWRAEGSPGSPVWPQAIGLAVGALLVFSALWIRPIFVGMYVIGVVVVARSLFLAVRHLLGYTAGTVPTWLALATALATNLVAAVFPLAFLAVPPGESIRPILGLPLIILACLVLSAYAIMLVVRSLGGHKYPTRILLLALGILVALGPAPVSLITLGIVTFGRGVELSP